MALRRLLLLIALPAATAGAQAPPPRMPDLPPAILDDTLQIGGADIDAHKVRTRMTAKVMLNDQGPYDFVVDSGADTSVIGARAARALALPPATPVTLHGMTGSSRVARVRLAKLGLGQGTMRDLNLPVLPERDLGGQGMIGIDALVEQRLMMDFEKRVINVEDGRQPAQAMSGDIVVVARRRRGQLILTQVSALGRRVDAVIDTGSEITIGNLALRDKLIRGNADKFKTVAITGVTGATMDIQLARIAELRIGPIVLRDVPMAFADVPPFALFGLEMAPSLLLGTDLLDKFRRVSLDFRARKARFQLRRCGSTAVQINSSSSMTRISLGDASSPACRR